MLEDPNLINSQENQLKQNEAFVAAIKDIEINEDPNSPLSEQNIQKRKEADKVQIEKLIDELKVPRAKKEALVVEKEVSNEEIARRIETEKTVEEIGRKQQEQKDRYNVPPEELGILVWEDKAIEAQKNIAIAESRLALSDEEFKEMFGELTPNMKEAIPRMIEENKKRFEEYNKIAQGLREKLGEERSKSK